MTNEEKRERRQLRHKLQREASKHLTHGVKLTSTASQLRSYGRRVADQLFAGINPATCERTVE